MLDKFDIKILKILQEQGNIPNSDLAKKIGISTTACWNRTQKLVKQGYIENITANLNPERLGIPVLVLVGVILEQSNAESFQTFEKAVIKIPVITECVLLSGEYDYLLKIRVSDIKTYKKIYIETLLGLPGVKQIRSFFALSEVKKDQKLIF